MSEPVTEFRIGPFSVGDLIALGTVIFLSGASWVRLASVERETIQLHIDHRTDTDRITGRLQALEQVIPSNYVRRDEYREDAREIKAALSRIEVELKTKVDK